MKRVFITLLFLLSTYLGFSQEGVKIGVGFGPAINFSRVETDGTLTSEESGLGSRLSLTGRYGFSENYGLQTGIALNTKAFGDKEDAAGKVKISTIEIPFGLSLRTNELNNNGLFVSGFFGPTIDINVSSRQITSTQEINNNENVKPIGSTIRFGLGVEKEFDFGTFLLGASYGRGVTNVARNQPDVVTKVHYLAFELSYFF